MTDPFSRRNALFGTMLGGLVAPALAAQVRPAPGIVGLLAAQVTPERYGGKADFTGSTSSATDNTVAIRRALAAATTTGLPLMLSGFYYCSAALSVTSAPIAIVGGNGRSGIVFAPGAGLTITQQDWTTPTRLEGFDVVTLGQESADGLTISYPASDSLSNRDFPRLWVDRLFVRGWSFVTHGWANGVTLANAHNANVGRLTITGRRDTTVTGRNSFGLMLTGLHLTSVTGQAAIPSDQMLRDIYVYNAQTAIALAGEFEGVSITGCKLVGVWTGISVANASLRPGLQLYGNHFNVFDAGVDVSNTPQAQIFENLIYKFEQSAGRTVGIRLTACDAAQAGANVFINSCTDYNISGAWDCVEIASCAQADVATQNGNRCTHIVMLTGGTTGTVVDYQHPSGTYTNSPTSGATTDTSNNPANNTLRS